MQSKIVTIEPNLQRQLAAKCGNNLLQSSNAHVVTAFAFSIRWLADAETLGDFHLREANLTANLRKNILTMQSVRFSLDS